MAKTHHFTSLPGSKELYVLLDIINDKDKYQKILDEIETARLQANKAIDDMRMAGDIEKLYKQAESDRLQADHDLQVAKDNAQKIIEEGHKTMENCLNEINERKAEYDKATKEATEKLNKREQELNDLDILLKKEKVELQNKTTELQQKEEYLEGLKMNLETKTKILNDSLEKMK